MLFAVSQSCPKPVLCWDTATILMQVRIQRSKLALLHHKKNLDESSLTKQIFNEQKSEGWPGMVAEGDDWKIHDILDIGTSLIFWNPMFKSPSWD